MAASTSSAIALALRFLKTLTIVSALASSGAPASLVVSAGVPGAAVASLGALASASA